MLCKNPQLVGGLAVITIAAPLHAVEAALGRTLPGIWVQPQAGVVGPTPGFSDGILPIGYMGTIGGARLVPIGGTIYGNVQVNISKPHILPISAWVSGP